MTACWKAASATYARTASASSAWRWNGGEQTLSTDALAAAGGEDASFRLTEVNGGLTMVLNGLTRNELLAK